MCGQPRKKSVKSTKSLVSVTVRGMYANTEAMDTRGQNPRDFESPRKASLRKSPQPKLPPA